VSARRHRDHAKIKRPYTARRVPWANHLGRPRAVCQIGHRKAQADGRNSRPHIERERQTQSRRRYRCGHSAAGLRCYRPCR